jgi:hypothetical protein
MIDLLLALIAVLAGAQTAALYRIHVDVGRALESLKNHTYRLEKLERQTNEPSTDAAHTRRPRRRRVDRLA